MEGGLIFFGLLAFVVIIILYKTAIVVPQQSAFVVERLGRYSRTLEPGLTIITPFVERVRPLVDLREQVVNFEPQPVITEDNVVVAIETVLYFTITEPRSATYEIANPLQAIEQHTHAAWGPIRAPADTGFADLAATFLGNCRRNVGAIMTALDCADFAVAESLAHGMRGAGGSFGFQEITDICAALEHAAAAADTYAARGRTDQLSRYLERVEILPV